MKARKVVSSEGLLLMEEGRETDSAGTAIILDVGVRYGLQGLLLPSRSSLLDLKLIKK